MDKIIPEKLKAGDEIRVVAPARSLGLINTETRRFAQEHFSQLGLKLSFGAHVEEMDSVLSSSVSSRVSDLHDAFADTNVKAIFTVIGGFNSNQLLRHLDWDLIKNNPKIFCGFSDITALNNAIYTKTSLVTYSGPHYSTLGQKSQLDYTVEYLNKCLFSSEPFELAPSKEWFDDAWWLDQDKRLATPNSGWWVMNEGSAEGTILGANLGTFRLLQGTEYFPDLSASVLFIEDDEATSPNVFDRDLQSLIHLDAFKGVKGIVIGRFQKASNITREILTTIISEKKELAGLPVIANLDFGHTEPKITFPIGGTARVDVSKDTASVKILSH